MILLTVAIFKGNNWCTVCLGENFNICFWFFSSSEHGLLICAWWCPLSISAYTTLVTLTLFMRMQINGEIRAYFPSWVAVGRKWQFLWCSVPWPWLCLFCTDFFGWFVFLFLFNSIKSTFYFGYEDLDRGVIRCVLPCAVFIINWMWLCIRITVELCM